MLPDCHAAWVLLLLLVVGIFGVLLSVVHGSLDLVRLILLLGWIVLPAPHANVRRADR